MLNLDPSNTLVREMHHYKPCIQAGLKLVEMDQLPGCPVRAVLQAYPSMHQDIFQRIKLVGVTKVIANPGYTLDMYADELAATLKGNGGNWIALIFDTKSVDKVYQHQVRVFLYQAVYHYNLKITQEPLFAFRNTVEYSEEIDNFVDTFTCVDDARCNRLVFTTEYALCNVARELVETGSITSGLRFIEKLKPSLIFS
ncbi:hypothetical protein AH04_160 [Erwinia phage AH04]|uniref:Uncharacterized protein n=1 Tax=Erwinia phage AH04 TaxID=2869569 RepID=A0AAE8BQY3_9CAUD|nr:hypothetical protein PQC02_gp154 [Erwinia phage AH04]QZA70635.1 hypothetical protein AH04_160 [Erwinia phage AH04]